MSDTTNPAAALRAVEKQAQQIQLLVLDVDGVLTDGSLYFTADGETMKRFHVRDGAGIVQLRRAGIEIAIISGRSSPAVTTRLTELGVTHIHQGIHDKGAALTTLLEQLKIRPEHTACMGDDTPDIPMFALGGLALAPADAHAEVKRAAHWISSLPGGQGAVREACDLILAARRAITM